MGDNAATRPLPRPGVSDVCKGGRVDEPISRRQVSLVARLARDGGRNGLELGRGGVAPKL